MRNKIIFRKLVEIQLDNIEKVISSGVNISKIGFSSGKIINKKAFLNTFEDKNVSREAINSYIQFDQVYLLEKRLKISLGRTIKSLEVAVSSIQTDDEILLHKLVSL